VCVGGGGRGGNDSGGRVAVAVIVVVQRAHVGGAMQWSRQAANVHTCLSSKNAGEKFDPINRFPGSLIRS
jgi:hypothetical protein